MAERGRVGIGLSEFYIADYANSGSTVTYSNGVKLGRAVSFSVEPESGDDSMFYADNKVAENLGGAISTGTFTAEIDGLLQSTARRLQGVTIGDDGWLHYNNNASGYFGLGAIVKRLSGGEITYMAFILPKVRFNPVGLSATTQGETTEAQTQELTGTFYTDDTTNGDWKLVGTDQTTERRALAELKKFFSIN